MFLLYHCPRSRLIFSRYWHGGIIVGDRSAPSTQAISWDLSFPQDYLIFPQPNNPGITPGSATSFQNIWISVHLDWLCPLPGSLVIFFNISPTPITYLLSPHHWKPLRSKAFLLPSLLSCVSPTQAELPPTLNSIESYGLFLLIRYLIVPGLVSCTQLFLG